MISNPPDEPIFGDAAVGCFSHRMGANRPVRCVGELLRYGHEPLA